MAGLCTRTCRSHNVPARLITYCFSELKKNDSGLKGTFRGRLQVRSSTVLLYVLRHKFKVGRVFFLQVFSRSSLRGEEEGKFKRPGLWTLWIRRSAVLLLEIRLWAFTRGNYAGTFEQALKNLQRISVPPEWLSSPLSNAVSCDISECGTCPLGHR